MRHVNALASILVIFILTTIWSVDSASLNNHGQADIDEYLAGFVVHRYNENVIEYLLLRKANGDEEWQPAKGHVEKSDASAYAAAIREVREETGLVRQDYQTMEHHLMHQYVAGDGTSKQVDMWPARVFNGNKPIIVGPEHSEYLWADISRVVELVNKRWRNNVFLPTDEFLNSKL